jgi:hypothetical protein
MTYDKWIDAIPYRKRHTKRFPRLYHASGTLAAKMIAMIALMKRTIVPSNIR